MINSSLPCPLWKEGTFWVVLCQPGIPLYQNINTGLHYCQQSMKMALFSQLTNCLVVLLNFCQSHRWRMASQSFNVDFSYCKSEYLFMCLRGKNLFIPFQEEITFDSRLAFSSIDSFPWSYNMLLILNLKIKNKNYFWLTSLLYHSYSPIAIFPTRANSCVKSLYLLSLISLFPLSQNPQ